MARPRRTSLPGGSVETTTIGGGSSGTGTSITPTITPTAPLTGGPSPTPSVPSVGAPRRGGGGGTVPGVTFGATLERTTGIGSTRSILEIMSPFRTTPFGRTRDTTFTDRFISDMTSVAQTRILNGEFITQTSNGINNLRPEILSKLDFSPIWKPGQINVSNVLLRDTSTIGDLVNFGYQTKLLRQETLVALISNIKKEVSPDPFKDIKKDFEDELRQLESDLQFLDTILTNIRTINSSLDIKSYSDEVYTNSIIENNQPVVIPTLKNLYTTRMQFTNSQYNSSSETKILLQILFDLTNTLTNYSINLIGLRDNDRAGVTSPSAIDKTYDLAQNEFSFTLKDFNRNLRRENITQTYDYLLRALPNNPDSIIKLLTYCLAKENLVSRGLGTPSNTAILNKYRTVTIGTNSNIFEQIIGPIGNTIFEKLFAVGNLNGQNTLSSLLYVDTGNPRNVVLPFENRYVQADDNTITYVPGSSYFSDAIITTDGSTWNVAPFINYANRFNIVFTDVKSAIDNLLNLSSFTRTGQDISSGGTTSTVILAMSPSELNILFAEKFQNAFKTYDSFDEINEFFGGVGANQDKLNQIKNDLERIFSSIYEGARAVRDTYFGNEREINTRASREELAASERETNLNEYRRAAVAYRDSVIQTLQDIQNEINTLFNPEKPENAETAEQLLISSLFNLASVSTVENNALRKELLILTLMAGIYKNATGRTRVNFFQKLVEVELRTFGDILNISTTASPGSFEDRRSVILNPNMPGFNPGSLYAAFNGYLSLVAAPIIEANIDLKIAETSRVSRPIGITAGGIDKSRIIPICDYSFFPSSTVGSDGEQIVTDTRQSFRTLLSGMMFGDKISSNTVFYQIVQAIEELYNSNKVGSDYVHIDSNGKTLFNGLNLSTQLLLVFETFIQYCKKYSAAEIFGTLEIDTLNSLDNAIDALNNAAGIYNVTNIIVRAGLQDTAFNVESYVKKVPYMTVKLNLSNQSSINKAINLIKTGNPTPVQELTDASINTPYYRSLYDNYKRIADEFNNIKDMLGIFEVVNRFIYSTSLQISNFFNQPTLQQFLGNSSINNIDFLRYPSQVRLANYIYQDIADKSTYAGALVTLPAGEGVSTTGSLNSMVVSDNIIPSEYNSMISMLSSNSAYIDTMPDINLSEDVIYRNNKIVTVGIPAGLTKTLADKISINDFNIQGPEGKQSDVINITIYPSDLRFAEITCKPIDYIFDLSLFVGKKSFFDLAAEPGELYNNLLNRLTVKDYEDPYNVQNLTLQSIRTDERYNFLTVEQINGLFVNTVNSYLLGLYINCLTGMKISEDVFISTPSKKVLNSKALTAVKTYLSKTGNSYNVTYSDTEKILLNADLNQSIKDTYRLMTYGSLLFNNKEATKLVNSGKVFDRVYHIPVNLRRLEIDIDATRTTLAGRMALERASLLEYITTEGTGGTSSDRTYLTTNNPNDFIIKDVFCAVSQIPSGIRRT